VGIAAGEAIAIAGDELVAGHGTHRSHAC
jgi:uncharacterized protein YoaH (UPF0181 family)